MTDAEFIETLLLIQIGSLIGIVLGHVLFDYLNAMEIKISRAWELVTFKKPNVDQAYIDELNEELKKDSFFRTACELKLTRHFIKCYSLETGKLIGRSKKIEDLVPLHVRCPGIFCTLSFGSPGTGRFSN